MISLLQAMWMLILLATYCEGQNEAPQITSNNNATSASPPTTAAFRPEPPASVPCTCKFECSHPRRACARCPVLTFEQLRNRESCIACIQRCFPVEVFSNCELQCQQIQLCPASEAIISTVNNNQNQPCRGCILQRCDFLANNRLLYSRCMYAANVECKQCHLSAYRISIRQQCDSCIYDCVSNNPRPDLLPTTASFESGGPFEVPNSFQPQNIDGISGLNSYRPQPQSLPSYPSPFSIFNQRHGQPIFQWYGLPRRPVYSGHYNQPSAGNYQG